MQVSYIGFYALYWGVPVLIVLIGTMIAVRLPHKKAKGVLIIAGFVAASIYYFWFDLTVKHEALTVYTAKTCGESDVRYHLPFGDGIQVKFDNEIDRSARTFGYYAGLTAISNQSDRYLIITEAIYTHEGAPARRRPNLDGYVIPIGETHAMQIHDGDIYFLRPRPKDVRVTTSGFELSKYEVQCKLTPGESVEF